jgi:hypothetical protein
MIFHPCLPKIISNPPKLEKMLFFTTYFGIPGSGFTSPIESGSATPILNGRY